VAVWNTVAPAVGTILRPVLKETIKGGLIFGRTVQTIAQEAWQDVEDLTAEAQAELDRNPSEDGNGATKA
jgi:hypothetical protein